MARVLKATGTAVKAGPCPICGKHEFKAWDDLCPVCGWFHDPVQENNPDEEECANAMSFNQAKEAYAKGLPIE